MQGAVRSEHALAERLVTAASAEPGVDTAEGDNPSEVARQTFFGIPPLFFFLVAVIIALVHQLLLMQRKLQRILAAQTLHVLNGHHPLSNTSAADAMLPPVEHLPVDTDNDETSERTLSSHDSVGSRSGRHLSLLSRCLLSKFDSSDSRDSRRSTGVRSLAYTANTLSGSAHTNRLSSGDADADHARIPCMQSMVLQGACMIPESDGSPGASSESSGAYPSVFDYDTPQVKLQRAPDSSALDSNSSPRPDFDGMWDTNLELRAL